MNKQVTNIGLLTFVIVTWGYSWVLMKIGLNYSEPLTFAAWRCAIGGISLIPVLIFMSSKLPAKHKLKDYLAVGFFQTTAMFGLMLYGMKHVSAGKTAVLLYTMPIWTSILVHFYLKEKLSKKQWTGVFSGFLGVLFILGRDTIANQNMTILFGEILILIASVSWAIANIWVKKKLANDNVYTLSCLQLLFGTIGLSILAIPTEGLFNMEFNSELLYVLIFTGVVASAIDFTIWFYLIKRININTATFSSMLVPVFGLLFDWIILGNKIDIGVIIGGILIIIGIKKVSKY